MLRRVPQHIIDDYQAGGGVVPVTSTLTPDVNMSPLIQIASAQVDSGVGTALRLRAQEQTRQALKAQKDGLEWQKEKWRQEFDLRTQEFKINGNLKMLGLIQKLLPGQMSTGVSSQSSRATGIPGNWHTNKQMEVAQETSSAKNKTVKDYFTTNKDLGNATDPGNFIGLIDDISKAEGGNFQNALEQLTYHQQQMNQFAKDPAKYDQDLFNYNMTKYFNGNDVDTKYPMVYNNIHTIAKDIFKEYKDRWGLPQVYEFDQIRQILQTNPDIRAQFSDLMLRDQAPFLQEKHKMEEDLREQAGLPPGSDYDTWAREYVDNLANVHAQPSYKIKNVPEGKEGGGGNDALPDIMTTETIQNSYLPAVGSGGLEIPVDSQIQFETGAGGPTFIHDRGLALTFVPDKGSADRIVAEGQGPAFEIIVRAVNQDKDLAEAGISTNIADYTEADGTLNAEAGAFIDSYGEMYKEGIIQSPVLITWQDTKDDGVFSIATNSRTAVDNMLVNHTTAQFLDLDTGGMITGIKLVEMYGIANIKKYGAIPGIIDAKNVIPSIARKGNQQVQDLSDFGAAPYYFTMVEGDDGDGPTHRYALRRVDSWLQKHPEYKAGNKIYGDAVAGLGAKIPINEDAIKSGLGTIPGMTEEKRDYITENVTGVRANTTNKMSSIIIEYGNDGDYDDGDLASGKMEVLEPHLIPSGLSIMETISKNLGPGNDYKLTQGRSADGTRVGWNLSINDGEPILLEQGNLEQNRQVSKNIHEAIRASRGETSESIDVKETSGRIDAKEHFTSAIYAPDADLNLTKRFVKDWEETVDRRLAPGYKITSGYRAGDPTAGKGNTIDLTGRDPVLNKWFQENVPGLQKSPAGDTSYYAIPGSPFAVAWHENMTLKRDGQGKVIKKTPNGTGYHYDIKYADEVKIVK